MLAIAIKDLKLQINYKNLSLEKTAIRFELYAQKSKKSEYFVLFSLLRQPNIN